MDYADSRLETGFESVYDHFWKQDADKLRLHKIYYTLKKTGLRAEHAPGFESYLIS